MGVFALTLALLSCGRLAAESPSTELFESDVKPYFSTYCLDCHSGRKAEAGLRLEELLKEFNLGKHRRNWNKVAAMVEAGAMPPADVDQPESEQTKRVADWLRGQLDYVDCDNGPRAGRVTLRRLNRTEYNNTIRDLLGIDFRPADDFPADDVGGGFDNNADVLSLPPILLEKYLAAAREIARTAIHDAADYQSVTQRITGIELTPAVAASESGDFGLTLASNGEAYVDHSFPVPGMYVITVTAWGPEVGGEPAKMAVRVDGKTLRTVSVIGRPIEYKSFFKASERQHRISAAFLNDYWDPDNPDPEQRDRNLTIDSIDIEGPNGGPPKEYPAHHQRIVRAVPGNGADVRTAGREVMRPFADRAFRRPATDAEVEALVDFIERMTKEGESYEQGVRLAVQATLVSPHFLYRVESDPEESDAVRQLNDYELASRLSYFLWSTMPDEELFNIAASGRLNEEIVLEEQVRRMLADPKAQALIDNFAAQWLGLRNLHTVSPDPARFPQFDANLRKAMEEETRRLFAAVLFDDLPVTDLLDANYTFVNGRLARHYGWSGIDGEEFRKVTVPDGRRGGVLTHASILTVTSNPTRTSPVKRGKWVLEELLGTPPPPPPPEVPALSEDAELVGTLRERMEQHRSNPNCASCHARLDPIGFGLENFDAIGRWRTSEHGIPIDSSGELPGGKHFSGPEQLRGILREQIDGFRRNLIERMLAYALGRQIEYYDRCTVDEIHQALIERQDRMSELILRVCKSKPFRFREQKGAGNE